MSLAFCLAARARGSGGIKFAHADTEVGAGEAAAPPASKVGYALVSKEERPLFANDGDGQSDNDDI